MSSTEASSFHGLTSGPITATREGVRVAIRLTPKARGNRIQGVIYDAAGCALLKVAVAAPPVEGRANTALIEFLAREWALPRRDLTLISGARDRTKLVAIAGEPSLLLPRLAAALAALPAA